MPHDPDANTCSADAPVFAGWITATGIDAPKQRASLSRVCSRAPVLKKNSPLFGQAPCTRATPCGAHMCGVSGFFRAMATAAAAAATVAEKTRALATSTSTLVENLFAAYRHAYKRNDVHEHAPL